MEAPLFSRRTAWQSAACGSTNLPPPDTVDLTLSDPTACGFVYDADGYAALLCKEPEKYLPASLGLQEARHAIAAYYAARGAHVSPEQVWLASGTSELLLHVLWLLTDPGDALLVPTPGYPLHDIVGDLSDVRRVEYTLHYDAGWHVDGDSLAAAWNMPGVKACCVVSPNNPTGLLLEPNVRAAMEAQCIKRGAALIVDEVFADYPLRDREGVFFASTQPACLAFVLSGLSKVAALPQMKLAWGVVLGPEEQVTQAMARLDQIADAFLSVSTPVQRALPHLLRASTPMQRAIRERCRENLALLHEHARQGAFSLCACEGGWNAVLRLPQLPGWDDARWAEMLLYGEKVKTHPGYLFNLPDPPPHLVVSLLLPTPVFRSGVARLREGVDRVVAAG